MIEWPDLHVWNPGFDSLKKGRKYVQLLGSLLEKYRGKCML